MKTQACKGAVCYIDLLGFSYLTEKLDSTVLYTNPDEEKPFGEKKIKGAALAFYEGDFGDFEVLLSREVLDEGII